VHFDIKPQNVVKQANTFYYKPFATMKNVLPKMAVVLVWATQRTVLSNLQETMSTPYTGGCD
jgi:hypothetical protein